MATATETRVRPIPFQPAMVREILAWHKTQTRRVVKWKPRDNGLNSSFSGLEARHYCTGAPESGWVLCSRGAGGCWNDRTLPTHCPYGNPGDRLWVRETLRWDGCLRYEADKQPVANIPHDATPVSRTVLPSMFMPRWASRLTLEVTDVRVQRVQGISSEDAIAEGCAGHYSPAYVYGGEICGPDGQEPEDEFRELWDRINGKAHPWASNPWVFAITFAVAEKR